MYVENLSSIRIPWLNRKSIGAAGATFTSCLTLSSALASCCWMSSSSSVSWLLFISSALFEHKDAFKDPPLKRPCERVTRQKQKHRGPSTLYLCVDFTRVTSGLNALHQSDDTAANQRRGRDRVYHAYPNLSLGFFFKYKNINLKISSDSFHLYGSDSWQKSVQANLSLWWQW